MTDEEFLRALESCTLTESEFGHSAHVRAGYLYLKKSSFAEAPVRMRRAWGWRWLLVLLRLVRCGGVGLIACG